MRSTAMRLAKSYQPMIRFTAARHEVILHPDTIIPHPCSVNNILPGSKNCLPVADFLSSRKPFSVVPYNNPKKASKSKTGIKYEFRNRSLETDEVSSIAELPARFRFRPIDPKESEIINGGGAY